MNDMERRKFEDAVKDAFSGAEASPTETVWTNIELDLERAEGDKMRRRIVFYKLVAAASVAFAMCMAGLGYYAVTKNESGVGGNALSINSTQGPWAQKKHCPQMKL
jgi:hypothetical protein